MPTTPGCHPSPGHQHGRPPGAYLGLGGEHRGFHDPGLDILAGAVHRFQLLRQGQRLDPVLAQQQPQPHVGLADPPAGVDPRPQRIAAGRCVQLLPRLGHVQQRGDPRTRPARHHLQALADEGAVHPHQRHHVADRGQRDQVEQPHQVRLTAGGEEAQPAQRAHSGDGGQERHAGGAQMGEARPVIQPVGIDRGQDRRRRPLRLVMVQHDDVGLAGHHGQRLGCRGAAVDANDQAGATRDQPGKGGGIGAVAFLDPIRHVVMHFASRGRAGNRPSGRRCRHRRRRSRHRPPPSHCRARHPPAGRRRCPCRSKWRDRVATPAASVPGNRRRRRCRCRARPAGG